MNCAACLGAGTVTRPGPAYRAAGGAVFYRIIEEVCPACRGAGRDWPAGGGYHDVRMFADASVAVRPRPESPWQCIYASGRREPKPGDECQAIDFCRHANVKTRIRADA